MSLTHTTLSAPRSAHLNTRAQWPSGPRPCEVRRSEVEGVLREVALVCHWTRLVKESMTGR